MTDEEIMEAAFREQFPPQAVVREAIRLAREDERIKLNPDAIRAEERGRLAGLLDEVKARLGVVKVIDQIQARAPLKPPPTQMPSGGTPRGTRKSIKR
jgi:hypothetical protein